VALLEHHIFTYPTIPVIIMEQILEMDTTDSLSIRLISIWDY